MMTRRTLMTLTGAGFLIALMPAGLRAAFAQTPQQAADLVRQTGDQLVAIVNGPGTLPEKRLRLRQVIDGAVDVDAVARFCLGRFWHQATPEQQRQYTSLFHEVLVNNITSKLGDYKGVRFDMGRVQEREDSVRVMTTVERPNNPPTQVEWVVGDANGALKIVDVEAEGTSLRLTQRSDYASYLARNGNNVQALIDALRQQAEQSGQASAG